MGPRPPAAGGRWIMAKVMSGLDVGSNLSRRGCLTPVGCFVRIIDVVGASVGCRWGSERGRVQQGSRRWRVGVHAT